MPRRPIAAGVGTAMLVLFGAGSVIAALTVGDLALGATALADSVSAPRAIAIEALGTFLLLFAIMAIAVDSRAPLGRAGLLVGLSVTCAILLIGPQTGGSLNPARTFDPDAVLGIGGGDTQWAELALCWIGPILGAALAAALYDFFAQTRTTQVAATESFTATNTTTGTNEA